MGEFSIWHWLIVLLVVMLLFGSGKVSGLMGDFAKGIKAFKKNMAEDEHTPTGRAVEQPNASISGPAGEAAPAEAKSRETTPAH